MNPIKESISLIDVQGAILDAIAVLEARIEYLSAMIEGLITSAAQAQEMAQSMMTGGLGQLLRGQKKEKE